MFLSPFRSTSGGLERRLPSRDMNSSKAGVVEPRTTRPILNVGSINGLVGMADSALYSATKPPTHSLTKSWAAEYGPAGVRVNTVAPDRIQSIVVDRTPSQRPSTPEQIAAAVAFLVS